MPLLVTTYYLEMLRPDALKAANSSGSLQLSQAPRNGAVNRALYESAGGDWSWTDRLVWSADQWQQYAERPELETWLATLEGETAGYFELDAQPTGDTEIVYFGLLPSFIGRGLGGPLLTAAVLRAWNAGAKRVWVHTCSQDHRHALRNYLARGFKVYRSRTCPKDSGPH